MIFLQQDLAARKKAEVYGRGRWVFARKEYRGEKGLRQMRAFSRQDDPINGLGKLGWMRSQVSGGKVVESVVFSGVRDLQVEVLGSIRIGGSDQRVGHKGSPSL